MSSSWLAALNPTVVLGTGLQTGGELYMNQQTNEMNRDLARAANETNLQIARENNAAAVSMWERQTAYNSPLQQMQRLKDAGLNPHLAYGTIAESRMATPPSLQAAHMEPARMERPNFQPLAAYQQIRQNQMLNQSVNLELAKRKAEAQGAEADAKLKSHIADYYKRTGLVPGESSWIRDLGRIRDVLRTGQGSGRPLEINPFVNPDMLGPKK